MRNSTCPRPGDSRNPGQYSTSVEVLEHLAKDYQVPRLMLEYRRIAKLKSGYVDALPRLVDPRTQRVHPSFHQTVAATGRLSCSNPNLQNIPVRSELGAQIRSAFVADQGCQLLSADYSQIELRVLAHLSQDPVLVDAFRKNEDIHTRTACEVFGIDPPAADQRDTAASQGNQLRHHLRPDGLWSGQGVADFQPRRPGNHPALLRKVSRRQGVHPAGDSGHPAEPHDPHPSSDGAGRSRTSTAAIPACASLPRGRP